jgi:hypothetical protein
MAARRRRLRWPRCRTVSRPPRPPRRRSRRNAPQDPLAPLDPSEDEIGPDTVPEIPDLPDGGGLIPDESPDAGTVFDAPTDVFDG